MPYTKKYDVTLYNEAWLRSVYVSEERNAQQIADLIGCQRSAVHAALRRFGIPIKDQSEAHMVSTRKYGSNAPRPRLEFAETLHDVDWLREHYLVKRWSKARMAAAAGCSAPALALALRRAGIAREETQPTTPNFKMKRAGGPGRSRLTGDDVTLDVMYGRSRRKCLHGPCLVCGGVGKHVNHIDRDPTNDAIENLERLCPTCHNRQHSEEERIAFAKCAELGVSIVEIHALARKNLLRNIRRRKI